MMDAANEEQLQEQKDKEKKQEDINEDEVIIILPSFLIIFYQSFQTYIIYTY